MKKLFYVMLAAALACSALWAAEFWEQKPYTEWNEKEVEKLLVNSPWAQRVSIPTPLSAPSMGRGGGGRGGIAGADGGGAGSIAGGGGGGGEGRSGADMGSPFIRVTLRWHSALPIRQALVRMRLGDEAATSGDAQKFLSERPNFYVVELSGLSPRTVGDTADLQKRSVLKRNKKHDIAAEKIETQGSGEAFVVYVIFPKTDAITLEDNNVEFLTNIGSMRINKKFKVQDMVFNGKLEI